LQSHKSISAIQDFIRSMMIPSRQQSGILMLVILLLFAPVTAAQSCRDNATAANALLESAKTLILADDSDTAITLINSAQALLDTCDKGEGEGEDVPTLQTTAAPETETPDSDLVAGGFLVQAPEVNQDEGIVFIGFAHTSVDAGSIDLYLDNNEIPVISQLAYGEATPLIPFNAGSRRFNARPAGSGLAGEVLYSMAWDYAGNSSWIVTAAGFLNELAFIVEPISIVRNNYDGAARVRVVNLVRDLRLSVSDASGAVFGNGLGWIGIKDTMTAPGVYTLNITAADGQNLGEPVTFDLLAETTYTLYLIGQPDRDYPIQILAVVAPQDVTRVRFVNSRQEPVDIHYRPGNDRLVESIAVDETSPYVVLASGAVTFVAYAPGTGPTGQELLALSLQLRPGRDMTITVKKNNMVVTEVTLP
jgi:hypothetical protein